MILGGIYAIVTSEELSARARKEKWVVGGNRTFVIVSSAFLILFGAMSIWLSIESRQNSDRSEPTGGWLWFWLVIGILFIAVSIVGFWKARKLTDDSEELVKMRKMSVMPLFPLMTKKGFIATAVFNGVIGVGIVLGVLL